MPVPQQLQQRRTWLILGIVALGIVLLLIKVGPFKATPNTTTAPRPALTVTAVQPQSAEWAAVVEASGAIAPWQEAIVGARVGGIPLAQIHADVGDVVKSGQLLALFDDGTVRAELAQAAAALAQAQANSRQADVNSERAERLKGTGVMSAQEALQYSTLADTTRAQVKLQEAVLAAARLKLSYARVTAPDDGVISSRTATLGAVTQSGGELFRLIRKSRLEWRAELTADQLTAVQPGMTATLTLSNGSTVTGRVRQVSPALDQATRMGLAYVDLDAGSNARAAMYANGRIATAMSAALAVPGDAVVIRDGRAYVFVLTNDKVSRVPVTTGRRDGKRVEILSGITAGQTVVARGAGFLNDGDVVRVVPADVPPT